MKTGQTTPEPPTLRRDLGRLAGQLMALAVRHPAAAIDLAILLDITEAIIAEQPTPAYAAPCVIVKFPERCR